MCTYGQLSTLTRISFLPHVHSSGSFKCYVTQYRGCGVNKFPDKKHYKGTVKRYSLALQGVGCWCQIIRK